MHYNQYYSLCESLVSRTAAIIPTRQRDSKGVLQLTGKQLTFYIMGIDEPVLTKRYISPKKAIAELIWMLRGSNDDEILKEARIKWWEPYGKTLGPIYGAQFYRHSQLLSFLTSIGLNRYSRRHVMSLWNVADLNDMCLPPCVTQMQLLLGPSKIKDVRDVGTFIVTQRSADVFIGLPYDILEWSLFFQLLGNYFSFIPRKLVFNIGSAHIYVEHIEKVKEMNKNEPIAATVSQKRQLSATLTPKRKTKYALELLNMPKNLKPDEIYEHMTKELDASNFDYSYYDKLKTPIITAGFYP